MGGAARRGLQFKNTGVDGGFDRNAHDQVAFDNGLAGQTIAFL